MNIINIIIQIIVALILIIILAFGAFAIYNNELIKSLNNFNSVRKDIDIFTGIYDFNINKDGFYNTYDKKDPAYIELRPSINQQGGAEYSYNFWLYIDREKLKNNLNREDKILFLRGDRRLVKYNNGSLNFKNCYSDDGYIMVKNPLVRINRYGDAIVIEYNNPKSPDSFNDGVNDINCSGGWYDRNKGFLGVYNMKPVFDKKWFMVSIVFKETIPDNDIFSANKTNCKMYINGELMLDRLMETNYNSSFVSSAMRHNSGNLYVNPTNIFKTDTGNQADMINETGCLMMADFKYYNYAITPDKVKSLYDNKFTKTGVTIPINTTQNENYYDTSSSVKEGAIPF